MNEVIGTLVPLGLAVALSPFPVIMIVLLLGSARPVSKGLAFLLGWAAGITAVVVVLTLALDSLEGSGGSEPNTVAGILRILLGAGLLFLAGRKFVRRIQTPDGGPLPAWMASAETMSPTRSLLMGLMLSGANPKNFMIAAGAGVTVGAAALTPAEEIWAALAFLLVASLTVLVPVTGYLLAPRKMAVPLAALMGWLRINHSVMTGLLLLVFGFVLIGNGIGSF
ncbi:MAG: GAP family protein [Specibacter sp.]